MKLCIIGPEKRTENEVKIIEVAKKLFETVLYIPYPEIGLSNEGLEYKVELSLFDAVLPLIKRKDFLFAYSLLNKLQNIFTPIRSEPFLYTSNRFLMLEFLRSHEIETPKVFLINSRKALLRMKNIKMPVVIRSSEEKGIMFATNKTELKTMVDSLGYSSPICIEEFYSRSYSQILVIGREVFGIQRKPKEKKDIYLGRGSAKKKKPSNDEKTIALNVANSLNTDFLLVTIGSKKVYDVSLYPNLVEISQILGIDVIHKLLKFIRLSVTGEDISVEKIKYDIKRLISDIFK